jgi:hypothetical protein
MLQVSSHDHNLGTATADQIKHRISMLDCVPKVLLAEDMGGDASISGNLNASYRRATTDDGTELDRQALFFLMENKVFQSRSPTGDQDDDG